MDYKKGDIVEILHEKEHRWGKVVDASNCVNGFGSLLVQILPDGGELFFSNHLIKKWTSEMLLPTRCPKCTSLWYVEYDYKGKREVCKDCNMKKNEIIKEINLDNQEKSGK